MAITVAVFLLKLDVLNSRDLALDEPFTLFNAQKPVGDILQLSANGEPNPPLFMLIIHYWVKVVGTDTFSVRVIPLLFHSLTAGVLFILGKRFFSLGAGVFCLGCFLLSNYYSYFALELRPYGFFSLLAAGALYSYLAATSSPHKRWYYVLLLCNVLLIYNHYFGWLVVMCEGLCTLFYLRDKTILKRMILVMLATAASFSFILPDVLAQFMKSSKGTWVEPPEDGQFRIQLNALFNSTGIFIRYLKYIVPYGMVLVLLHWFLKRFDLKYITVMLWWLVPFSFMFFISDKMPIFVDRYVLFNSIGLFVFIAALLHLYLKNRFIRVGLYMVLLVKIYGAFNSGEEYYRREIASAVKQVKELENNNSMVALFPPFSKLNFSYHYNLDYFKNTSSLDSMLEDGNIFPVWNSDQALKLAKTNDKTHFIFFTNMGTHSSDFKSFKKHMDTTCINEFYKEYPDNLCVMSYRINEEN